MASIESIEGTTESPASVEPAGVGAANAAVSDPSSDEESLESLQRRLKELEERKRLKKRIAELEQELSSSKKAKASNKRGARASKDANSQESSATVNEEVDQQ